MIVNAFYIEDNRETMSRMDDGSINLILTSPPYNLNKDYEEKSTTGDHIGAITKLFDEYYRILSDDGSICFQVGNHIDKGAVYPLDCLLFSHFIQAGFIPRNRIVWSFGHGLHCKNRFSGRHETILWFTKSNNYKFNLNDVRVPQKYPNKKHFKGPNKGLLSGNPLGKNPSDVWDIPNVKHNHPEKTAHPCQFPEELCSRLILCLTNVGDKVYDPYSGSGTTCIVADKLGRSWIGSELRVDYVHIAEGRLNNQRENIRA